MAFQHILCPVDFSDASLHALGYAAGLAARGDTHVTVLHVIATQADDLAPHARLRHDALARLHAAIEHAGATGPGTSPLVHEGRAAEAIVRASAAIGSDLLVMGTHGLSGFHRLLLGSVTEKVVRTATVPVLTVPPSAPRAAGGPLLFTAVLAALDYSPSSLKALEYALALGRAAHGRISVLHALEYLDPDEPVEPPDVDPFQDAVSASRERHQMEKARERLRAVVASEARAGCYIDPQVTAGRAYKAILARAAALNADLIVMGAHGHHAIDLMPYGSNTHHVVRSARCPVLTVRA